MSTELELKHTTALARVLALIASGEANSITAACKMAGVKRSTYYAWRKEGHFDETLSALEQDTIAEVITKFHDALPRVFDAICADAESPELSARDRDTARRTLLLYKDKLAGTVSPPATGESGASWLQKHGQKFQPIQIVGSQVVINQAGEPEVVDELEEG